MIDFDVISIAISFSAIPPLAFAVAFIRIRALSAIIIITLRRQARLYKKKRQFKSLKEQFIFDGGGLFR